MRTPHFDQPSRGTVTTVSQPIARSGLLSLIGAMVSALAGFVLTIVIARTMGTEGAGIVLQSIAAFTIVMSLAQGGLDTTAVWLLPRVADENVLQLRSALVGILVPAAVASCLGGAALWTLGTIIADTQPALSRSVQAMSFFIVPGVIALVALSATRALGGIKPFILINSICVPTTRPLLVLLVTTFTAGTLGVTLVWVAPLPLAAVAALYLLLRLLKRWESRSDGRGTLLPDRDLRHRIRTYSLPRWVAATLEQGMLWLDVLLVGFLASAAAAGVYGSVARFVGAGLILNTAMRIVVAPMYSRALGQGRPAEAQRTYTTTTKWIVAISTPVYLLFAVFGQTVLSLLGPGFTTGATALLILCVGFIVILTAGNIHSMLLMSGHSGLAAINKASALTLNVVLLFILVPWLGIEGAALAWSVSMVLDAGLAASQVHRLVGIRVAGRGVAISMAMALGTVGTTAVLTRMVVGDTPLGLLTSVVLGGTLWCVAAYLLRHELELADIGTVVRRRDPR